MKTTFVIGLATLLLSSCQKETDILQSNTQSQSLVTAKQNETNLTTKTTETAIVDAVLLNPCTNENMIVTGYIEFRSSIISKDNMQLFHDNFNYSHVSAIGETSGLTYNVNGIFEGNSQKVYDSTTESFELKNGSSNYRLTFSLPGSQFQTIFQFHIVDDTVKKVVLEDGVCN